mgnify:CR=1 FL=1
MRCRLGFVAMLAAAILTGVSLVRTPAANSGGPGYSHLPIVSRDHLWATQVPAPTSTPTVTPTPAATGVSASRVSPGFDHTCVLTSTGGVKCWGDNSYGQLGDGTTTGRFTPGDVTGLASGVSAVSSGANHTCVLTDLGGVKCWGSNFTGQLGDGTTTDRHTPVDVIGLTSGVSAVSAGLFHTCAVTDLGGLKCWGQNSESGRGGRLGVGTTTDHHPTPVDVLGLSSGVAAVAAGHLHTCALTALGGVKCWGENSQSQLGNGTTTDSSTSVDVIGLTSGVSAVSASSDHTCVLTDLGGLKCWGSNFIGQLGDGTATDRATPVDVTGLTSGVAAVSADADHTCALTNLGGLKCWGGNMSGQLGDGTTTNRYTPVDVTGLASSVVAMSAGRREHMCAVTSTGGVKCWGGNSHGQIGDGTTTTRVTPVDVLGFGGGPVPVTGTPTPPACPTRAPGPTSTPGPSPTPMPLSFWLPLIHLEPCPYR